MFITISFGLKKNTVSKRAFTASKICSSQLNAETFLTCITREFAGAIKKLSYLFRFKTKTLCLFATISPFNLSHINDFYPAQSRGIVWLIGKSLDKATLLWSPRRWVLHQRHFSIEGVTFTLRCTYWWASSISMLRRVQTLVAPDLLAMHYPDSLNLLQYQHGFLSTVFLVQYSMVSA